MTSEESRPITVRRAKPVANTLLEFISEGRGGGRRPGELFLCIVRLSLEACGLYTSPMASVSFSLYSRKEK